MYLAKHALIHSVAIIVITINTQHFKPSVLFSQSYRRMGDPVKHVCLHRRIMQHVFKNDIVAYTKAARETPIPHKIARETTVSP